MFLSSFSPKAAINSISFVPFFWGGGGGASNCDLNFNEFRFFFFYKDNFL